jgi:NAD dependent epimerase/dehydratase family enzyme
VTMKDFCITLGRILKRPCRLKVPGFALRLALGEMADEMLLSGQKVLPKRLLDAGFKFKYPDLEKALSAIYK